MKISVIITTYNRPFALQLILQSLSLQSDKDFEILIADDGSSDETRQLLEQFIPKTTIPIKHIWQEDRGFRAAAIRNKAIAAATGDYIIFLDGDVVPNLHFIGRHRLLAEQDYFLAGNRALLSPGYTEVVIAERLPIFEYSFLHWLFIRLKGGINRLLPLIKLPLSAKWRKRKPNKWEGVKTCNLAVWKKDLLKVNGLDEAFIGWGFEDSDLVVRLFHSGVRRKEGRFAVPVFHLWHTENDRSAEKENWQRFLEVLNSNKIKADRGLDRYL